MKSNIVNKRSKKNVAFIICINIIIIAAYKIGRTIAAKSDLLFRGWIDNLCMINILILTVMIIVLINIFLCSNLYSKIKDDVTKNAFKAISTLITVVIIFIVCNYGYIAFAFLYAPEHIVYTQDQKLIAKEDRYLFHTFVNYYEPVNIFLMKKSNVKSEMRGK
jgi:hypothetical protein